MSQTAGFQETLRRLAIFDEGLAGTRFGPHLTGPADAVRGQYDGYLDVEGVTPHSSVETFAAVRLAVDTWRWADVPVLIRAGKCMPVTATEVTVRFRRPAVIALPRADLLLLYHRSWDAWPGRAAMSW